MYHSYLIFKSNHVCSYFDRLLIVVNDKLDLKHMCVDIKTLLCVGLQLEQQQKNVFIGHMEEQEHYKLTTFKNRMYHNVLGILAQFETIFGSGKCPVKCCCTVGMYNYTVYLEKYKGQIF